MTGLIDADGMVYVISYNHRDHDDVKLVQETCDDFVKVILSTVQATAYIGSFSAKENFRHRTYKYAPYKGLRPEKPEWFQRWEPVIKNYLCDTWGFIVPEDLEADDMISAAAEVFRNEGRSFIVCSPDKDLRQIAGYHFDYKKQELGIEYVSPEEAMFNFTKQLLCGDTSDNIKAVPGMGPVKAVKFLKSIEEPDIRVYHAIKTQYRKSFGDVYGEDIYKQTHDALKLMQSDHAYYQDYTDQIITALQSCVKDFDPNNTPGVSSKNMDFNPFGGL